MIRPRNLIFMFALLAAINPGSAPAQDNPANEPESLQLSLKDCVGQAFKNNKQINIASYTVELRDQDIAQQEAVFDPNVVGNASYTNASSPSAQRNPSTGKVQVIPVDSTQTLLEGTYIDPLRFGANWSADLSLSRRTSTGFTLGSISFAPIFPEEYRANLSLQYDQSFLKGFGKKVNETQITIQLTNKEIDKEAFRQQVIDTLLEVESSYWSLVYERQDLEVRKEALALAQELLRLNKIRVEVGTLPPIDITQAEAGVASTEEAVIVAQANIADAEDRLRRVMGMDPKSEEWQRSIEPTDDYSITTRDVDLDSEIKTAIANRTDLESARLQLKNDDTTLAYQRNQLKYTLNGRASLQYQGLSGDTPAFPVFDANGMFLGNVPPVNSGFTDPLMDVKDAKFPTWSVQATLGIPIGNRAAEAQYVRARLQKEQQSIQYDNLEQAAIVAVAGAVRTVGTDLKRIDAAEKNRVLQEKTVEAEQKKFENGLSTSFQVLQFQRDLAEARSAENAAKRDYQTSLANLDAATGVLEKKFDIKIEDYSRE